MGSEKKKEAAGSENPPIMVSNLDTNMLEPYGEPDEGDHNAGGPQITFTQNTVPFDFDGERLLYMQYHTRDHREIYLYTFATRTRDTLCTF